MPGDSKTDYFVLRAEWLRYKSNLYDKNTNLPTLSIVFDDARKMVEEHGTIGLMLIDFGRQKNFEATYGWQKYDEVLRHVSEILEESRNELLHEKDLIAISHIRGDEFILFLNPPADRPWNESALEVVSEKMRNSIKRKLERFSNQRWHSNVKVHTGYASVLRDPTIRIERSIQRALATAREVSGREVEHEMIRRHIALQKIISQNSILILFQPIVFLDNLRVLGYEALSRGPEDSGFEGTEILFTFAESTNMLLDLERLCRKNALRAAQSLNISHKLFLNSSAKALQDKDFTADQLAEYVSELGLQQDGIVLEITERVAIQEWVAFKKVLRQFRNHGFQIAIDDMGAGYSSLQAIAELEPDYLKFDVSLVRNIQENLIKKGLLETLVSLSSKINASVIAEGIEEKEEYEVLRSLGVQLGQGYYFASPSIQPPHVSAIL
ncbi:EAL domain-containing protein [bacterium]|nr:EAL domain-containing protein [bacterium]MCI0606464.1 EAL domain-containing protein [bacterium]